MYGSQTNNMTVKTTNTNNSVEVQQTSVDTMSCLAWSPVENVLAAGSWDKSVRVWTVAAPASGGFGMNATGSVSVTPRCMYSHEGPVLCVTFTRDGQNILSGGCDNKVKMYNLASQRDTVIGQHDQPVKEIAWCEEMKLCITVSWDKTMRFWGIANVGGAVATIQLPERPFAMDMKFPLLVVATADRQNSVFNLQAMQSNNVTAPQMVLESKLKMQNRCMSCFPDKTGFAQGSIEGRCSIVSVMDPNLKEKNFEFKCHRQGDEIFVLNSVDFHPNGVFLTAGSDGVICIWDKDTRSRIKLFNSCNYPITAAKFSALGDFLAYSVGYDWSKGHEHHNPNIPVKLYIHKLLEDDVKRKPTTTAFGSNTNSRRVGRY